MLEKMKNWSCIADQSQNDHLIDWPNLYQVLCIKFGSNP